MVIFVYPRKEKRIFFFCKNRWEHHFFFYERDSFTFFSCLFELIMCMFTWLQQLSITVVIYCWLNNKYILSTVKTIEKIFSLLLICFVLVLMGVNYGHLLGSNWFPVFSFLFFYMRKTGWNHLDCDCFDFRWCWLGWFNCFSQNHWTYIEDEWCWWQRREREKWLTVTTTLIHFSFWVNRETKNTQTNEIPKLW